MAPELLAGERQDRETKKAVIACNDYLRMGPGRSLAKLLDRYQNVTESPPSKRLPTLKDWSRAFGWQVRAATYDATWEQRKNTERERVFNESMALDYERVRRLNDLASFLEDQIYAQIDDTFSVGIRETEDGPDVEQVTVRRNHNVWLHDVKQIGSGDEAERVDIVRFNAAIIAEFRATLDDLAKETGGRVKRSDMTSNGEKIDVVIKYADD